MTSHSVFYEANAEDLLEFSRTEQDSTIQNLKYDRTILAIRNDFDNLEQLHSDIDRQKIARLMSGLGFFLNCIDKAMEEVFTQEN